jgi:enediyne polyketide synthase
MAIIQRVPRDRDREPAGVAPWVRCFTEQRRAAQPPQHAGPGGPWRLRAAPREPLGMMAGRVFGDNPNAGTVLAVLGSLADAGSAATLLQAAREAAGTGRLVVISTGSGVTGFCASLQAEHPTLGVTVIRTAAGLPGLQAARPFAAAAPGVLREVVLDEYGAAAEPTMVSTVPGAEGTFPLGPADVVLVSGMTRPGDLACATALASRGAALAILAPPGPEDPRLTAYLAELRTAGARVSRKQAELTDPAQVSAAVRSMERGLGTVTAVAHAAGPGPAERCAQLSEEVLCGWLAGQERPFSAVLASVAPERLRILVTFGSITARYGAPGGACDGLASELLAEQAREKAGSLPRCRSLHVDWAPWAEQEEPRPEPGAATPVPVPEAARLLISMLTTADLPPRVAVHGRLARHRAVVPARGVAGTVPRGRFLDAVRVHYPGVELVVETRLSLSADPYLADYRIDGLAVLPAAMALEAMAQAASALAGAPLRHVTGVRMAYPVAVPSGETVIRVCALRTGNTVEVVLRCAESGFGPDHARAVFSAAGARPAGERWRDGDDMPAGGIVDGTDLYGPVHFQAGRFRRVAFLPEVSSRRCRALVRGSDDKHWFGAPPGAVDVPLILGSPGLNDAALQVVQACLPHRRLLVVACESVTFSGELPRGPVEVHAARRPRAGRGGEARTGVLWDIWANDTAGQLVVAWAGVAMRDLGPLARASGWQPTLLAACLEARAAELGIDPTLRASISSGRRPLTVPPPPGELALPRPRPADGTQPGRPPRAGTWTDRAVGLGPLDGLELTARAARPVACRWLAAGSGGGDLPPREELGRLRDQLAACLPETPATVEARLITIASCLSALGWTPRTPCALEAVRDSGWIVIRAGGVLVGCTVTEIGGVPAPVAVSVASNLAGSAAGRALPPAGSTPEKGVAESGRTSI